MQAGRRLNGAASDENFRRSAKWTRQTEVLLGGAGQKWWWRSQTGALSGGASQRREVEVPGRGAKCLPIDSEARQDGPRGGAGQDGQKGEGPPTITPKRHQQARRLAKRETYKRASNFW